MSRQQGYTKCFSLCNVKRHCSTSDQAEHVIYVGRCLHHVAQRSVPAHREGAHARPLRGGDRFLHVVDHVARLRRPASRAPVSRRSSLLYRALSRFRHADRIRSAPRDLRKFNDRDFEHRRDHDREWNRVEHRRSDGLARKRADHYRVLNAGRMPPLEAEYHLELAPHGGKSCPAPDSARA